MHLWVTWTGPPGTVVHRLSPPNQCGGFGKCSFAGVIMEELHNLSSLWARENANKRVVWPVCVLRPNWTGLCPRNGADLDFLSSGFNDVIIGQKLL